MAGSAIAGLVAAAANLRSLCLRNALQETWLAKSSREDADVKMLHTDTDHSYRGTFLNG